MRNAWLGLALAIVTACGSVAAHDPDAPVTSDPVITVAVTPDIVALKHGFDAPKQLMATATRASTATEDVTATATWTTSDPTIATVTNGLVTATGAGMVTITATFETKMGVATFTNTNALMIVAETSPAALSVYDAYQTGNSAPIRQITGAATTLGFPWSMAVFNGEIYVADLTAGTIDVFPLNASGNIAPSRRLNVANPLVVAIYNNELYTATNNGSVSTILVFPLTASGAATPTRTITGAATTLLAEINGLAFYNDEMYVASEQSGAVNIVVLPPTATGNAAATRTIAGANTNLFDVWDLRVANGEIYVADLAHGGNPDPGLPGGSQAIHVFSATATGNVAPLRNITGANTGLTAPLPMNVLGDEIYTLNIPPNGNLVIHPRTATGDAAPTRTLAGPLTKIVAPRGITFF